jgi:hypothetical protein
MELAAKARQMQNEGVALAAKAIEGEVLSGEDRGLIEQLAISGNEDAARELEQLNGAEIAIFSDGFARNAYLRQQVAMLADEKNPDLDLVISRLYALQAKTMPWRGGMLSAIPLLNVYEKWRDAAKHHNKPIILTDASRKNRGKNNEHIDARFQRYLVPATTLDREVFAQLKDILAKASQVLISRLDNAEGMTARQVVWYALHFLPESLVMSPTWVRRVFEPENNGLLEHRDSRTLYMSFELSGHETFLMAKSTRAELLMQQLKALAES